MSEHRIVLIILCLLGAGGCYYSYKYSPANNTIPVAPKEWVPPQSPIIPPTPIIPVPEVKPQPKPQPKQQQGGGCLPFRI